MYLASLFATGPTVRFSAIVDGLHLITLSSPVKNVFFTFQSVILLARILQIAFISFESHVCNERDSLI